MISQALPHWQVTVNAALFPSQLVQKQKAVSETRTGWLALDMTSQVHLVQAGSAGESCPAPCCQALNVSAASLGRLLQLWSPPPSWGFQAAARQCAVVAGCAQPQDEIRLHTGAADTLSSAICP